jgi:hypothetical protein
VLCNSIHITFKTRWNQSVPSKGRVVVMKLGIGTETVDVSLLHLGTANTGVCGCHNSSCPMLMMYETFFMCESINQYKILRHQRWRAKSTGPCSQREHWVRISLPYGIWKSTRSTEITDCFPGSPFILFHSFFLKISTILTVVIISTN